MVESERRRIKNVAVVGCESGRGVGGGCDGWKEERSMFEGGLESQLRLNAVLYHSQSIGITVRNAGRSTQDERVAVIVS
jgi:hypothetical protein